MGRCFSQVFADPELAPLFEHIDAQRLKHKQEVMMDVVFGGLQVRTTRCSVSFLASVSGARTVASNFVQPPGRCVQMHDALVLLGLAVCLWASEPSREQQQPVCFNCWHQTV